jgi:hypothetical protein
MKISTFLVSIMVVALCITGFVSYYVGITASYQTPYTDQISSLDKYNETYNITSQINDQLVSNNTPVSVGGFAVIGDLLSYGYNSIRLTFQSIDLFYSMLDTGFDNIPIGDSTTTPTFTRFKYILGGIVFILFFLVIISVLVNRQDL